MVDKTGRRVYTEYNSNRDGIHIKLMRGHRAKEDIMRTYEEIVLGAAEIAIEENGGRINCFEIEDFKAFTKTWASIRGRLLIGVGLLLFDTPSWLGFY